MCRYGRRLLLRYMLLLCVDMVEGCYLDIFVVMCRYVRRLLLRYMLLLCVDMVEGCYIDIYVL